jgi:hypothetical protein
VGKSERIKAQLYHDTSTAGSRETRLLEIGQVRVHVSERATDVLIMDAFDLLVSTMCFDMHVT